MLRLLDALNVLLSPITAAWGQEFGRSIALPPRPAEPQAPQPRPTPLPEPEPQPATSPSTEADRSATDAEFSATVGDDVPVCEPVIVTGTGHLTRQPESSVSAEPAVAVKPAEPLYVRRGEGKGSRYAVAAPGEPGTRYRRQVAGKRARYEPVR